MPNYNVSECSTNTAYIVSASTLSVHDVISFYNGESGPFCGTVLSTTVNAHDSLYTETFGTCCECLSGTSISSFSFENCLTKDQILISLSTFCNVAGFAPTEGRVFKFYEVTNPSNTFCATYLSASTGTGVTTYEPESEIYQTCSNCESDPPRSANTEVFMCEVCCPCTSGGTITSVVPPHPVWTDGQGTAVTQLNMVVLGGENGLNS